MVLERLYKSSAALITIPCVTELVTFLFENSVPAF